MLSMIYHTHKVDESRGYKKYLLAVKCVMQYLGRPHVVKQYVLWKYHQRGGEDDERLRQDLEDLIRSIRNQRRRHLVRRLGRGLRTVHVLEDHVPRELGLYIISY